jgi:hypothetical protein
MRRAAFVVDRTLRPHERHRWWVVIFLTALFILPLLVEVVCCLTMPGLRQHDVDRVTTLMIGINGIVAVAAPIALFVLRGQIDHRFGCSAWLISSSVLYAVWAVALMMAFDEDLLPLFVVGPPAYLLRLIPIGVVAGGLRRLVGLGAWRHAIGVLVGADAIAWLAWVVCVLGHLGDFGVMTSLLLAANVVLGVGLLLAAVCSWPAFKQHADL